MLFVALWQHIRLRQTLSRVLLIAVSAGLLASTNFQNVRQVYKNTIWHRHGGHVVRVLSARQCGDSLIVKIQLRRPWKVQPGDFIYLRLLTRKCGSIFQRHPFVITWWDERDEAHERENQNGQEELKNMTGQQNNTGKALALYVMIDPQHGWTRNFMAQHSAFENQVAWLDGPFGPSYRLEEYSTVILFASGNGIVAQLPLLRGLATKLTDSAFQIRRVKLVWQTENSNEQLQKWMHEILRNEELDSDVGSGGNLIVNSFAYVYSFWICASMHQCLPSSSKLTST